MKKQSFLLILGFLSLTLTVFYACQKDITTEASMQSTPSLVAIDLAEEENCDKMVHTAALGVLNLSKNPQFRAIVHQKCLEKFDDDYNVLLKNLKLPAAEIGIDLTSNFVNSIEENIPTINSNEVTVPYGYFNDNDHVMQAIDGYDYYEEKNYLQIYVPNFEAIDSDEPNVVADDEPIIVIYPEDTGEEEQDAFAYVLQEDGTFKSQVITPDFANSHLIWVVSINETKNISNGTTSNLPNLLNGSQTDASVKSQSRVVEKVKHVSLKSINVLDSKESFWGGRPEIYKLVQHLYNCQASTIVSTTGLTGTGISVNRHEYNLGHFGRFKRRRDCILLGLDAALAVFTFPTANDQISELRESEDLALVVYEYDGRKKNKKSFKVCSGSGMAIEYYSKQLPYFEGSFNWYDLPNYPGKWFILEDYQSNPIDDTKGADGAILKIEGKSAYD